MDLLLYEVMRHYVCLPGLQLKSKSGGIGGGVE